MSYLDQIKNRLSQGGFKSIGGEISEKSEKSLFQAQNSEKPLRDNARKVFEGICDCQPLVEPLQTGPVCPACGFKIWCSFCGGCRSCWLEEQIQSGKI